MEESCEIGDLIISMFHYHASLPMDYALGFGVYHLGWEATGTEYSAPTARPWRLEKAAGMGGFDG